MGLFAKALLAAAAVASVGAVDISVQSTGGNPTGKFGHSYGYGFLHEVDTVSSPSFVVMSLTMIGHQQLRRWWHLRRIDSEPCFPI